MTHGVETAWSAALAAHLETLSKMQESGAVLSAIVDAISDCLAKGGKVILLGNGGSAADAQHIAAELTGRFRLDRPALAAIALTTDTSALTAIGNDMGFEQVFSRQLEALLRPNDIVWALSTSGNSPNVIRAAELCRARGNRLIGFTGGDGGRLAGLCDYVLRVPHSASDRIQEGHMLAYHFVCECVEARAALAIGSAAVRRGDTIRKS